MGQSLALLHESPDHPFNFLNCCKVPELFLLSPPIRSRAPDRHVKIAIDAQQRAEVSDLEESALRGELPWVDHPEDDANRAICGMARELVSTPTLQALFDRCFRDGLHRPEARPVMAEWAEALEAAAAMQVTCCETAGGCGSTFLWNTGLECPFCGTVQPASAVLRMKHLLFAPLQELGEEASPADCWIPTSHEQVVGLQSTEIRSSPPGSATYVESAVVASLWIDGNTLVVRPTGERGLWIMHQGSKKLMPVERRLSLERKGLWHTLLLGKCDQTHGAWRFKW